MARQTGPIQLEGSIGDITFVKSRHGFFARRRTKTKVAKSAVSRQRLDENKAEFTRAANAGKFVRTAFRPISIGVADPDMLTRLHQQLSRVIKEDTVNVRGQRTAQNGQLDLLQGFNFNGNTPLSSRFAVQPEATIDRTGGTASVAVPLFAPGKMVTAPEGASHFSLMAGLAQVDFTTGEYLLSQAHSPDFPVNSFVEVQSLLTTPFEPNTNRALLLAYGIEFKQVVNGQMYPLNDKAFNALTILLVEQQAG